MSFIMSLMSLLNLVLLDDCRQSKQRVVDIRGGLMVTLGTLWI